MTLSPSDLPGTDNQISPTERLALAAAVACVTVLPASELLTPGEPQPGNEQMISIFSGAATVELSGAVTGRVTVLVGEELVGALASSPLGGLDLAAAVQPALDAAAAALSASAQAARLVDLSLVLDDLGGPFTAVPLLDSGIAAALLIPDHTLALALAAGTTGTVIPPAGGVNDAFSSTPLPTAAAPGPVTSPATGHGRGPHDDNVRSLADGRRGIEMLHGVEMEVTVELGRTRMPVRDLLALAPGAVLTLDRAAGSPADLLVNGRLIARGEVVVIDEDFGLRITEILDQSAVG